jgi:hypothetical protein
VLLIGKKLNFIMPEDGKNQCNLFRNCRSLKMKLAALMNRAPLGELRSWVVRLIRCQQRQQRSIIKWTLSIFPSFLSSSFLLFWQNIRVGKNIVRLIRCRVKSQDGWVNIFYAALFFAQRTFFANIH